MMTIEKDECVIALMGLMKQCKENSFNDKNNMKSISEIRMKINI
jgi:hypothetical protein